MNNTGNQLGKVVAFALLLTAAVIGLGFVPSFKVGDFESKKVDLFADIRTKKTATSPLAKPLIKADTLLDTNSKPAIQTFPCPKGITCFENYSSDSFALKTFIENLKKVDSQEVNIAFFGDSFIEGDIFCGDFRDSLQKHFGGSSIGYMPLTSAVSKFRRTIQHTFNGIGTQSIVDAKFKPAYYCPSGYSFSAENTDNSVTYKTPNGQSFNSLKLFYNISTPTTININGTSHNLTTVNALNFQTINTINSNTAQLKLPMEGKFYGVCFADKQGIGVDNFSLRGNSGLVMNRINANSYAVFNKARNYKLVILQYGLNAFDDKTKDFTWYLRSMKTIINGIKQAHPNASILMLGVPDRSHNTENGFQTMPQVLNMIAVQRALAKECGLVFWNTFEAMGGENSMVKYAEAKPALANKDYTHLTHAGGKAMANLLLNAMFHEINQHKNHDAIQ